MSNWIKHGCQKRAVAKVLIMPMPPSEIRESVKYGERPLNSHIELRDIWLLMHEFIKNELVICLTDETVVTGKIYTLSALGREVVSKAFGIESSAPAQDIDWGLYSWVVRGKTRREVMIELEILLRDTSQGKTAGQIRKSLRERYPVGLNATIRALKALEQRGLLECVGVTEKGKHRLYGFTGIGGRISEQLTKQIHCSLSSSSSVGASPR